MLPYFDLKRQYLKIKEEILKEVEATLEEAIFTEGPAVEKFEKAFANFCQINYAVGVNSGTSALHLAISTLRLKPDDEVLIPANTFIAAVWAAIYENAKPVFVDCDPQTWQINPDYLESKISKKTKAIIAVHLYGQPCDISTIKKVASEHNLALIEDCAHAAGAMTNNRPVGTIGDFGCFSFYPTKNLGTYGEGGAIVTNIDSYERRIRRLKSNGTDEKYLHLETGYNMRMGAFEAAVLNVKLRYLPQWNSRRQEIATLYYRGIQNSKIKLQQQLLNSEGVFHLFVVTAEDRNTFIEHLAKKDIQCNMHYPVPLHLQPALKFLNYSAGDFPNAEFLAAHCVSLPIFPEMTQLEINKVIEAVNSY